MKVDYKPGTDVEVVDLGDSWLCTVRQYGACSRTGLPYTAVFSQKQEKPQVMGEITSRSVLKAFVLRTVRKFEAHEVMEWLRFDGELNQDPHEPGTDPDRYDL